jgi:hypothetical protein
MPSIEWELRVLEEKIGNLESGMNRLENRVTSIENLLWTTNQILERVASACECLVTLQERKRG